MRFLGYTDAGAASAVVSAVVAGVSGVGVVAKTVAKKVVNPFKKAKPKPK